MKKRDTVSIKRTATLWGIFTVSKEGLVLLRNETTFHGEPRPVCGQDEVVVKLAKGHVLYDMPFDEFIKMARKSEFIGEE